MLKKTANQKFQLQAAEVQHQGHQKDQRHQERHENKDLQEDWNHSKNDLEDNVRVAELAAEAELPEQKQRIECKA